ncbi:MAG: flagellar filament capping protein FliD [Lachnospiraceae bacterium]|nr:flagellar filament capping protein FliD [Lachnospiraceae bacterium]
MPMRITGLASGLDTESMVAELVKASSGKKTKLEKEQTKMEWKQDAWKSINTEIKNFYTQQTAKLKFSSAYAKKKTTVADSKIATIVAGDNAVNGTQTLSVQSLAKTAYLTGGKINASSTVKSDTKLSDVLGIGEDEEITFTLNNGTEDVEIKLTGNQTIANLASQMTKAGVNATFDEKNQRFFVSALESGKDSDFSFTATSANGLNALSKLGLLTGDDLKNNAALDSAKALLNMSDDDIKATSEYNELYLAKLAAIEEADTEGTKTPEEKAEEAQNAVLSQMKASAQAAVDAAGDVASAGAVKIKGQNAQITLNGAVFESNTNSFSINGLTITATAVSEVTGTDSEGNKIYAETAINTADDVDAIYDTIKSFFKQYNELITKLDKLYNAESSKGYEPLTDDEKEAMSDDEIEKWENKIKDALLRRDGNLNTIINTLKTGMLESFTVGDEKLSLSTFGIATLGYFDAADNEHGCYHIAGDPDDASVTDTKDKLKAAIAEDPARVTSFFQQLTSSLYNKLNKLSAHTENRSYGSFYDDTKLSKDYKEYKSKISKAQDELTDMEDRYYKQFANMETALEKLNSQQNYVSQLFGN